jgi:glyoxylase-like metal-dependent hydrolase (beta-lactamase superfamily II)
MPSTATRAPDAAAPRPPRAAATLAIVRDGSAGIEVLLLRRAERGDQNSGAWVFPGGLVDAGDRACHAACRGLDDAQASAALGVSEGGLDHWVAALRESFEEAGLLYASLADDASGALLAPDAALAAELEEWRAPLQRGERRFADLLQHLSLRLAADRAVYVGHWITPLGRPKRFDTRFFVAEAPAGQAALHDAGEVVEHGWFAPAAALARSGELKLMTPTLATLEILARHPTVAALMAWARTPRDITPVMPRIGRGAQGMRPVTPDEPAFAELGRIDPEGAGNGSYDLVPGMAVRLSTRLIRVTADNGSMMTGPGTNSYLIGGGPGNEWAVIDPGPHDEAHVESILAAAPGPIRWILATHTHPDHSPACMLLKRRTGAEVLGRMAAHPQWQDASFAPDRRLAGGERLTLDGATLRVIHTPGHASNHLCYLLEEEKTLFTGDHVMQLSTVVINPPDGDMAAYLASLRKLFEEDLDWLAPGHGFLMARPQQALQRIVEHRLKREAKVVAALASHGPASAETLLASVYAEVPERLHGMAVRSLLAHLLKLRHEGHAVEREGRWSAV